MTRPKIDHIDPADLHYYEDDAEARADYSDYLAEMQTLGPEAPIADDFKTWLEWTRIGEEHRYRVDMEREIYLDD